MKKKDVIKGNIYYSRNKDSVFGHIWLCEGNGSSNSNKGLYDGPKRYGKGFLSTHHLYNLRLATVEEANWLKECIKRGKFIKKDEVLYKVELNYDIY